ncbi:DUF2789 domain-containing protein [Mitsuaria sp. WAJ17]|uniref:DUF2789 family protein n=1 Tax=Mitsuaria sp. WAJ17 TaxID=2761452 RepID=UPI0015FFDB53|nr:DUF2789 family protein [Mitsuaria sp. WAJ17]MBB2488010.1 DUF2789 domain-containing protein [Mitsuaria sp. WAJ17]
MNLTNHRFTDLFAQLGLPDHPEEIRHFIWQNSPLDPALRIDEAPFWTPAQARLLREELSANADWAQLVDQLSNALRVAYVPEDRE